MSDQNSATHSQPPKIVHPDVSIRLSEATERFELWDGDQFIGFLGFRVLPDLDGTGAEVLELQHTVIDEQFSRRGYARALVTLVLNFARDEGLHITSSCSYVDDYLNRYPEEQDLLAQ